MQNELGLGPFTNQGDIGQNNKPLPGLGTFDDESDPMRADIGQGQGGRSSDLFKLNLPPALGGPK